MNRLSCFACQKCNGICDNCFFCEENMLSHNLLFFLLDDFKEIFKKAKENLFNQVLCINEKLNIYINDYESSIDFSEKYLNLLINEKFMIENDRKKLENEIKKVQNEYKIKTEQLNQEHQINTMNDYFNFMQKKIYYSDYYKKIEDDLNSHIKYIEKKKQNLLNNSNNFKEDKDYNDFIAEQTKIYDEEFKRSKIETDGKYDIEKENIFEYTEKELKEKNEYLNQIKKIKEYSHIIPNFENWIIFYGLNKYL